MRYGYRVIKWSCLCGVEPLSVNVGVTSNGELIGVWRCAGCHKEVKALIPIEKLICDIPPPPEPEGFTEQDIKLMLLAHINLKGEA